MAAQEGSVLAAERLAGDVVRQRSRMPFREVVNDS